MTDLYQMKITRLREDEPRISDHEIEALRVQIPDWQIREVDGLLRLERVFRFPNFTQALLFTNKVGALAEEEDHHPLIITEYGKVTVDWWTHKVGGLHKNDFIMAARTDQLIS